MQPIEPTKPTPITNHGFAVINLYDHPLLCSALAAIAMMPIPRPVCMKVSFKYLCREGQSMTSVEPSDLSTYLRSKGGMPPSSLVSRLNIILIAKSVPPKMPAP